MPNIDPVIVLLVTSGAATIIIGTIRNKKGKAERERLARTESQYLVSEFLFLVATKGCARNN